MTFFRGIQVPGAEEQQSSRFVQVSLWSNFKSYRIHYLFQWVFIARLIYNKEIFKRPLSQARNQLG